MRRLLLIIALAATATGTVAPCRAQEPDRRGEIALDVPEYQGVRASAPIPPEDHIKNEGGSDGAGLCVISSILANGRYQHVPGLEGGKDSELWREAKARPGGYYPEKLEKLVNEALPGEQWFSWEGDGTDLLERYSAAGYPIGATMNTGALYNYMPIHHMISLIHLDRDWACVVDNNDPGKYHWMPAREFGRRFPDAGKGWGFVWLRKTSAGAYILPSALLLIASAAALFAAARSRNQVASS